MENKRITFHRRLQKPKQQSRKDKFRGETPRTLNENYSSSSTNLEAETAFKAGYGARNSLKSEALRRVFDSSSNSMGPSMKGSAREHIERRRRNGKLASSLSSNEIYRGFYPSGLDSFEEDDSGDCSSIASTSSSCKDSCNVVIGAEEITTSPNQSYGTPPTLILDSLHTRRKSMQEDHRNKILRTSSTHALQKQEDQGNLTEKGWRSSKEARSPRDSEYPSLSQKYRPKCFKELVGQNIVVKSLQNAIIREKIAPVYLFHGPRGTGKTSAARIFALAMICLSANFESKPCWECRECSLFRAGENQHIIEINAGSHICIEKIKMLRNSVKFSNSVSGYKIFIVKDCQILTPEVWNNFMLKSLKHPIDFVVFILIATDLEMVPRGAVSSCQKIPFQKLKDLDMFSRLQKLAAAENIDIEEGALHLITANAHGSLLDAEDALDQLNLLATKVTLSMVRQMVGLIPYEKLVDLLEFALTSDTANTVRFTKDIIDSGVEPLALVSQLATLITDILAGGCTLQRANETQRFFNEDWLCRDKTEKLGRSLKSLAEAEKQIRASNDCTSSLMDALLQLAPDDLGNNIVQNQVDFLNACEEGTGEVESATAEEACHSEDLCKPYGIPYATIPVEYPDIIKSKHSHVSDPNMANPGHSDKSGTSIGNVSAAPESVGRPATSLNYSRVTEEGQMGLSPGHSHKSQAFVENLGAVTESVDPSATSLTYSGLNEGGQMGLEPMSPCKMEQIWRNVLGSSQSTTIKELLHHRGKLISLMLCRGHAIAHLEFGQPQHKAEAERLEGCISSALQDVLGCPVEVNMTLAPSASAQERKPKHHTMCGRPFCRKEVQVKRLKWRSRMLQLGIKFVPRIACSDRVFRSRPTCFTVNCFPNRQYG